MYQQKKTIPTRTIALSRLERIKALLQSFRRMKMRSFDSEG